MNNENAREFDMKSTLKNSQKVRILNSMSDFIIPKLSTNKIGNFFMRKLKIESFVF